MPIPLRKVLPTIIREAVAGGTTVKSESLNLNFPVENAPLETIMTCQVQSNVSHNIETETFQVPV